jgi:hypothetical protein
MLYHKRFVYAATSNISGIASGQITIAQASNNVTISGHAHPAYTNQWTRHDMMLNYGTTDAADGVIDTFGLRWDGVRHSRVTTGLRFRFGTRARWRWMMSQEYLNFIDSMTFDMGDWYFCRGNRARFEIANSADYATASESYIQLPVAWSASSVQFRGWKGMLDSFVGKSLFFIGENGLPVRVGSFV